MGCNKTNLLYVYTEFIFLRSDVLMKNSNEIVPRNGSYFQIYYLILNIIVSFIR